MFVIWSEMAFLKRISFSQAAESLGIFLPTLSPFLVFFSQTKILSCPNTLGPYWHKPPYTFCYFCQKTFSPPNLNLLNLSFLQVLAWVSLLQSIHHLPPSPQV